MWIWTFWKKRKKTSTNVTLQFHQLLEPLKKAKIDFQNLNLSFKKMANGSTSSLFRGWGKQLAWLVTYHWLWELYTFYTSALL